MYGTGSNRSNLRRLRIRNMMHIIGKHLPSVPLKTPQYVRVAALLCYVSYATIGRELMRVSSFHVVQKNSPSSERTICIVVCRPYLANAVNRW